MNWKRVSVLGSWAFIVLYLFGVLVACAWVLAAVGR